MYITVNDREYWVNDYGSGEAIVLLHGFTGSSNQWDLFVPKWAQHRRVVTIDLPGHGRTQGIKKISMELFSKDLAAIFIALGIDKAYLIGYSLGGRTALSFAMLHPDRVKALVLESASPGLADANEQIARQAKDEQLANKIKEEGLPAFVDYWENISLFASQQHLRADTRKQIREERLNQTEEGLAMSLLGMGTGTQPSWWNQLAELSIPVLLIVGELDEKFVGIAKSMTEHLKYSRIETIPNAGHTVHVEQPEIFDTIVSDFVRL